MGLLAVIGPSRKLQRSLPAFWARRRAKVRRSRQRVRISGSWATRSGLELTGRNIVLGLVLAIFRFDDPLACSSRARWPRNLVPTTARGRVRGYRSEPAATAVHPTVQGSAFAASKPSAVRPAIYAFSVTRYSR